MEQKGGIGIGPERMVYGILQSEALMDTGPLPSYHSRRSRMAKLVDREGAFAW